MHIPHTSQRPVFVLAAILLLAPISSHTQQMTPPPATPQPTTPTPPPPPKKEKKKKKEQPAPTPATSADATTYSVTVRTDSFGSGGVSNVDVRISAASGPGMPITGQTNYSGEFEVKLPAGDYDLALEQGTVSIHQNLHVDASSSKLILINFPTQTAPGGPPR